MINIFGLQYFNKLNHKDTVVLKKTSYLFSIIRMQNSYLAIKNVSNYLECKKITNEFNLINIVN